MKLVQTVLWSVAPFAGMGPTLRNVEWNSGYPLHIIFVVMSAADPIQRVLSLAARCSIFPNLRCLFFLGENRVIGSDGIGHFPGWEAGGRGYEHRRRPQLEIMDTRGCSPPLEQVSRQNRGGGPRKVSCCCREEMSHD